MCQFSYSQIQYDENHNIYYQDVFEEGDISKESLKEKANAWLVKKFDNTNNGIKMNTSDNLIGKGRFDGVMRDGLGRNIPAEFGYTLEISFKDGRYRLTINQLTQKFTSSDFPQVDEPIYYPYEDAQEYITHQRKVYESTYSGATLKAALNRLENENKVSRDMEKQWKYYNVVEPQIISHFEDLSKSLSSYIKTDSSNDDW